VEALTIVIVKNVTSSSEEAKVVAAGQEMNADLEDLLQYVFPMHRQKDPLTCHLNYSAL